MKVIIAGSRDFNQYEYLKNSINSLNIEIEEIVSGCAKGADLLGEKYAIENNIAIKKFPAEWNKHGKSAGMIRNTKMAEYADCLIAFPLGESRGTRNMIAQAQKYNLKVYVFESKI